MFLTCGNAVRVVLFNKKTSPPKIISSHSVPLQRFISTIYLYVQHVFKLSFKNKCTLQLMDSGHQILECLRLQQCIFVEPTM